MGKGTPREAVEQLLLNWADKCSPRMSTDEVMRCVRSIAQKEGPHTDEVKVFEDSILTVDQLYATVPEDHVWVLEDYIPKGSLVMLASEEKIGKVPWWARW